MDWELLGSQDYVGGRGNGGHIRTDGNSVNAAQLMHRDAECGLLGEASTSTTRRAGCERLCNSVRAGVADQVQVTSR